MKLYHFSAILEDKKDGKSFRGAGVFNSDSDFSIGVNYFELTDFIKKFLLTKIPMTVETERLEMSLISLTVLDHNIRNTHGINFPNPVIGYCADCRQPVKAEHFRSEEMERVFYKSGLCQTCQDGKEIK